MNLERTVFSFHGLMRFTERFPDLGVRDMVEAFAASIQWGAQCDLKNPGGTMLRLDAERGIVFGVKRDENGRWLVTTVLTKDQATANMQSSGLGGNFATATAAVPANVIAPDRLAAIISQGREDAASDHEQNRSWASKRHNERLRRDMNLNCNGAEGDEYRAAYKERRMQLAAAERRKATA